MTVGQEIAALKRHGVTAEDGIARFLLEHVGYRRTMRYVNLVNAKDGIAIEELHSLMLFDRKMQAILMEYIGLFEIQFRSQYARLLAHEGGAFAHRDPLNYKNRNHFDSFLSSYEREFKAQVKSGNDAIARSYEKYGDAPVWQAVEIVSFGTLSKLYTNTRSKNVKRGVADSFGVKASTLESWTRTLTFVRNRCAHFGILVGLPLPVRPAKINGISASNSNPFYCILILEKLLCSFDPVFEMPEACYGGALIKDVIDLFNAFGKTLNMAGIPDEWEDLLISEEVTGVPLLEKSGTQKDGPLWFALTDENGRIVSFNRWGAEIIEPNRRASDLGQAVKREQPA